MSESLLILIISNLLPSICETFVNIIQYTQSQNKSCAQSPRKNKKKNFFCHVKEIKEWNITRKNYNLYNRERIRKKKVTEVKKGIFPWK